MAKLVWDQVGQRFYESGIDQGVLYPPNAPGVPWNGLTSFVENEYGSGSTPLYFDGFKYYDDFSSGEFSASLKAITYPDEFLEFEGVLEADGGILIFNQHPKKFGISYRTKIGSDVDGDLGYKIHVLDNLTATPAQRTHSTTTAQVSPTEFEWKIKAIPSKVPGYRPTSHIVIDSRRIEPTILEDIEDILYGTAEEDPRLPKISDLINFAANRLTIRITDNLDGTWSAYTEHDELIVMLDATTFQIDGNAVYLDADTYQIDSTLNE